MFLLLSLITLEELEFANTGVLDGFDDARALLVLSRLAPSSLCT